MNVKSFFILISCGLSFWLLLPTFANELSIGKEAKLAGEVDIAITPPADFNFKTRAEILTLRKKEVLKHADLLKTPYSPDYAVFSQMEDRRPWWGDLGQAYYGPGRDSIKGRAEESRFILNPFLLAGQEDIIGLIADKVAEADLARRNYPTFIEPTRLRWWPREGKAEVTYDMTAFKNQMTGIYGVEINYGNRTALEIINASDLGLKYLFIPPAWAYNVDFKFPMRAPIANPQYIHCGGSCGYPGGCNNMSPSLPELQEIVIKKFPARLSLMFWKKAPITGREPPDLIYTINYR